MIKDASNKPISELFDVDSKATYFIPKYQREYTWARPQWESLFDDLQDNETGYYLGSFICISQSKDSLKPELEVIDGQQRLTTLSLLFAAIYKVLKGFDHELTDDQRVDLANLKRKLVLKNTSDELRVIPQIQNSNLQDFKAVLSDSGIIGSCEIPAYAGNRKIFRAYRYMQERVTQLPTVCESLANTILKFLEKVCQVNMVKIEVGSHTDAYILFESLNNRGMPLTAIDLIKNKLLAKVDKENPGNLNDYFAKWNKILSFLGDDYSVQERFFRQYYNAFKAELKDACQATLATRSNLIQIYEKLINHDASNFLTKLNDAAKHYSLLLLRGTEELNNGFTESLRDLDRIQGSPSYLLLLYLFLCKSKLEISDTNINKIVKLLVCFFVRRNLTDMPATRDMTRLFMNIVELINDKKGDEIVSLVKAQLVKVSATSEFFVNKLKNSIYEENSWVTRFILCKIAEESMTRENITDLWKTDGKQFIWTIEHIFPQGERIPEYWVIMIADGDEKKAKQLQETHVHKLGNLTITAYNRELGNKSFIEKRDRKDKNGLNVGYKNNLKLNEDLATSDCWTTEKIDQRTDKLIKIVSALFDFN